MCFILHRLLCWFRECVGGIGEEMLVKAYNIIDTHQEDFVEVCQALMCIFGVGH